MIALLLSVIGLLGPTTGALVHNVGSCLVVLFAGLLYDRDLERKEGSSSSMGAKTAAVREGR